MLYLDSEKLPESLKDDTGYGLCLIYAITFYGKESLSKKLLNSTVEELESFLTFEKVSPYKIVEGLSIMKINEHYVVAVMSNQIVYDPTRGKEIDEYSNGNRRIYEKFRVC